MGDEIEFEPWKVLPGASVPKPKTMNKIWPDYDENFDPLRAVEQQECRDVMFDRFGQRISFLESEMVRNLELRQAMVKSLTLPYENF